MDDIEQIYRKYAQPVYRYLYSLCHNEDQAEELTQETFFQAIKSADRYDGTCKVYVWLCQIGKHLWYHELEREKRRGTQPLEDDLPGGMTLEENRETKMEVFQKLRSLDEPVKEVMYLRLTGAFSFSEIGELMGKSETWARVTFYRGKQKLVQQLKEDGHGPGIL